MSSVWLRPGTNTYMTRVWHPDGRVRVVSTGMQSEEDAVSVAQLVWRWRGKKGQRFARPDVLSAVFVGDVSLAEASEAHEMGTLNTLMSRLSDKDLDALVHEWAEEANAKYVTQVRRLIPEGKMFPASAFTKSAVRVFLGKLTCSGPTKNRYRAALSVFAKWLVERDIIETNVVRDVSGYKEHDPREAWLSWSDLKRVILAAPAHMRAPIALAGGAGLEYKALIALRLTDVDFGTKEIRARGTKTRWRNRTVRAEEFVWPILQRHCQSLTGHALLFPELTHERALAAIRSAEKACGLPLYRFHDLRHTYAVNALKSGLKAQTVAHQLGHKDATMVVKVYGKYVPDAADYERPATKTATST